MRLRRLHPRRVGTITIRGRMPTAIRLVRIMLGEPGLLSGAHVRLPRVRRPARRRVRHPVRWRVRPRGPRLGLLAAVVGVAVAAAADAGEVGQSFTGGCRISAWRIWIMLRELSPREFTILRV